MFAITQMISMNFAFPDICKTPPFAIPIPYPNFSMSTMAIPNVFRIFIQAMPVHNQLTITPISNGDEAGCATGLISNLFIGSSMHLLGSFRVFKNCIPSTKLLNITGQNGPLPNMVGLTITPSQVKILIMS